MTTPAAILSENLKRATESEQGYRIRVLSTGMRRAHNEGIEEAERIILKRQATARGTLETELSNIIIKLHEAKVLQ